MPPAVAIPLAIAGATMVANNVQQKAALKNNENQQASAVNNAKNAYQTQSQNEQNWLKANPSPTNATIARPAAGGYGGAGPVSVGSILGNTSSPSAPPNAAGTLVQQIISQMMRQAPGQAPPPPAGQHI